MFIRDDGGESMIIESISIKGIGPFSEAIELRTDALDKIVAITGHNGVGKTFLLECIPGALYSYFPFRMYKQAGFSIYDFIQPGVKCFLGMTFHVAGRKFRIERTLEMRGSWTGNTFKQSSKGQVALLSEFVNDEWIPRADSTSKINKFVEREICPRQLFLASCFNSQNSAGDMVDCSADERKAIFASIIGMDDLQEKKEFFSNRVKQVDELIRNYEIKIESERPRRINEPDAKVEVETLSTKLDSLRNDKKIIEEMLEKLMQEKSAWVTAAADFARLKEQADKARKQISEKEEKARSIKSRILGLDSLLQKRSEKESLTGEISVFESEIDALSDTVNLKKELTEERTKLDADETLESSRLVSEINIKKNDLSRFRNKMQKAKTIIAQADGYAEDAAILDELDCPANCKYVKKARAAKEWLFEHPVEEYKQKYELMREKEDDLVEDVEVEIKAHHEGWWKEPFTKRGMALDEEIKNLDEPLKKIETLQSQIRTNKSKISMYASNNIDQKIAEIEASKNTLPELETELSSLTTSLEDVVSRGRKAREQSGNDPSAEIEKVKGFKGDIERGIETTAREIQGWEIKIKASEDAAIKVRLLEVQNEQFHELKNKYGRLAEAFSRSGIQALVIDSEKMQFLDIARELFTILSGGKMALYFQTQKTIKSGEKREDFDLLVTVGGVMRKLEQCSQGQQDLARIVMRATLGIYHSAKSGSRIQTYFLDETTGALDELNREYYFDFLKYLQKYFQQIFVISHQDITGAIPCQITISDEHIVSVNK